MKKINIFFYLLIFVFTTNIHSQSLTFDFSTGYEGWTGDFADYPVMDSVFHELEFARDHLPLPLDTNKYALKIAGNNHSDDLFMFIKRKISGLLPNTNYQFLACLNIASNAPTNAVGVGGSPDAVFIKVGVSMIEPLKIDSGVFYRMNIGHNSGDNNMADIGNIGVSDTTTVFTLINRNNTDNLLTLTTDDNGEVWVWIGTDSGYEAKTTLYYSSISLTFTVNSAIEDDNNKNKVLFYPNPVTDKVYIDYVKGQNLKMQVFNIMGRCILQSDLTIATNMIDVSSLTSGIYIFRLTGTDGTCQQKLIKK